MTAPMTAVAIFVIVSVMVAETAALNCYQCYGVQSSCQFQQPKWCNTGIYCKLVYDHTTGYVQQTCATEYDCPGSPVTDIRSQTGSASMSNYQTTIVDCCNYDNCNCLGTQCQMYGTANQRLQFASSLCLLGVVVALML